MIVCTELPDKEATVLISIPLRINLVIKECLRAYGFRYFSTLPSLTKQFKTTRQFIVPEIIIVQIKLQLRYFKILLTSQIMTTNHICRVS